MSRGAALGFFASGDCEKFHKPADGAPGEAEHGAKGHERDRTFLPVLNEVEKQSLHERQPLPEAYLGCPTRRWSCASPRRAPRSAIAW